MANVVGQGVIVIGADASDFDKDLHRITDKSSKSAGEKSGSTFGANFAANLAAAGVQRAVSGVASTIGLGFSTAMETEVANMKFTQLFKGQTDKAQGFIADLKAFANRTPFDFPGLSDSASKFLAVGIEADKVIPIMTNLGDITSIMGTGAEGIKSATRALTQMATKGKVTGEELLQMSEAGIPGLKILSESMGVPIDQLQKMIEKGLVPADAMFKALGETSGKTVSEFSGGMAKMATTTEGKISTLKDNFGQFAGTLVTAVLPAVNWVTDALAGMVTFFSENETATKALGVTVGVVAALILGHFVAMGVAWAVASAQAMIHAVRIAAAWLIAMGPIGWIIAAVIALVAVIIYNLDTIKSWISSAWDWITEKTHTIWNGITAFFQERWDAIVAIFTETVDIIKGHLSAAWEWIKNAAGVAWEVIKWVILGPIGALVRLIIENWDTIKAAMAAAWQWIQDTAEVVWYGIQRFFAERWNTIRLVFTAALDTIKGHMSAAWNTIRDTVVGAWNRVRDAINAAWEGIKSVVSNAVNAVVSFVAGLPGRAVGALAGLGSALWDAGVSAFNQLLEGAKSALGNIGGWASSIKDKIVDAIKSVFGINSPSTVMAGLGVHMMEGLLKGLMSSPQLLASAVKGIGSNIMGSLGGAVDFVQNLFGGGRVSIGGKLLDADTYGKIMKALGGNWSLTQGSWSNSVAASAGTHSGSGVADLGVRGIGWEAAVAMLRSAGLIAWFRNWVGNQHIHLVNPAAAGLSSQAAGQVASFMRGGNGLAYAAGTSSAAPGWGLVGERGPEWMRFRGGEQVLPNGQTPAGGGIVVNMSVSVDDLAKMSKVGDFLTMLDRSRLEQRRTARSGAVA